MKVKLYANVDMFDNTTQRMEAVYMSKEIEIPFAPIMGMSIFTRDPDTYGDYDVWDVVAINFFRHPGVTECRVKPTQDWEVENIDNEWLAYWREDGWDVNWSKIGD